MELTQAADETDEISLVIAARDGDREAFGQLVERYERSVYALAYRRLGDHCEAQEICQEAFVRALEKLSQLRQPQCFGAWLRSMTVRLAINRAVRRKPLVLTAPQVLDASHVDYATPLDAALHQEQRLQVRAGLRRLRKLDRNTLVAFYVKGHSLLEMSDQFDSPVGTIKRRLHVARKRLAKQLEELAV